MKPSDPNTRRSDEIRRRRLMQTQASLADGARPARHTGDERKPLLERLLGKRRDPAAARSTRRLPVPVDERTQGTGRVTSRRRLNLEASAGLTGETPVLTSRTARRQRASFLERMLGPRVDRRSGRSATGRSTARPTQPTPPPVLTRGRFVDPTATPLRHTTRTRRVYDVPLNRQGAEVRLPALPRLRMSWRVTSLFLLALLGAGLYYLWTAPDFQVEKPHVSGLQRLTSGMVNKELALTGKRVFSLDAAEIEQDLLTIFPEFSAAQVQIELPNTVLITVTERVPVLVWNQDDRERLVDADGMTFPTRQDLAPGTLPKVYAQEVPPAFAGGMVAEESDPEAGSAVDAAAAAAADTLEAVKQVLPEGLRRSLPDENQATPLLSPQVVAAVLKMSEMAPSGSDIVYDRSHGFGWQDKRGWVVYFGNFDDMEMKLRVYRSILDSLKTSGVRPELISVEYVYAPFYRVQQQEQQ